MTDSRHFWCNGSTHPARFYCGFHVRRDGTIHHAAPIIKWANGWDFNRFVTYALKKGWTIGEVP